MLGISYIDWLLTGNKSFMAIEFTFKAFIGTKLIILSLYSKQFSSFINPKLIDDHSNHDYMFMAAPSLLSSDLHINILSLQASCINILRILNGVIGFDGVVPLKFKIVNSLN